MWFPVNYLVIEALRRYARLFGDDLAVEQPAGSGIKIPLEQVAADLSRRLVTQFTEDEGGRPAVFGGTTLLYEPR